MARVGNNETEGTTILGQTATASGTEGTELYRVGVNYPILNEEGKS